MRFLTLSVVVFGTVALSGCSLISVLPGQQSSTEASTKAGSIWRSGDGGQIFVPQSKVDEKTNITASDMLTFSFHPNNPDIIYAGTVQSGIFRTENGGGTWANVNFPPQKVYSFTIDRNDPDHRMFASGVLGGYGKIFRTDDGTENWREVYSEPTANTVISSLVQHEKAPNVIFAGTSDGTVVKSTDGGDTWKNVGQKIDGPVTGIAFDAEKPYSVYLLSLQNKIYYSSDGGANWIDWEEKKRQEVKALYDNANRLQKDGHVLAAEKAMKQVQALEKRNQEGMMPQSPISFSVSPFVSGVIYIGAQGGLYRSTDYGKYWTKVNIIESATQEPIRAIAQSYANRNEISFVAGRAFYKSLNAGGTWAVTQLEIDRPVSVLSYDPIDSNVLYIGLRKR